jgi:hypothetical protein
MSLVLRLEALLSDGSKNQTFKHLYRSERSRANAPRARREVIDQCRRMDVLTFTLIT